MFSDVFRGYRKDQWYELDETISCHCCYLFQCFSAFHYSIAITAERSEVNWVRTGLKRV